jgi:hypothetical protein
MTDETNLQTFIRRKRSDFFVGRQKACDVFSSLLQKKDICILNIYGVGGVGKSTLLEKYATMCQEQQALCGLVDGKESSLIVALIEEQRVYSAVKILESFVQQINLENRYQSVFKEFKDEAHELYKLRAKLEGIEAEKETSSLLSPTKEFLAQAAGSVVGAVFANVPGAIIGAAIGTIGEQASERIGRTVQNLRRYKLSHDEIDRCLQAESKITTLFVRAMNRIALISSQKLILMFDTYEEMGSADAWVRNLLLPELNSNIGIVIAGRDPLCDKWNDWIDGIRKWELQPLLETEAVSYLQRRGITERTTIDVMLSLTNRLPWALTLVTELHGEDTPSLKRLSAIPSLGRRVVERFFSQVKDDNLRDVIEACSLTLTFDADLLAAMLGRDVHQEVRQLQHFSFIEVSSENRLSLSDLFREFVCAKVRQERPSTVLQWNQRATKYYEELFKVAPASDIPILAWNYLHHQYFGDEEARNLIVGAKIRKGIVEIHRAREGDLQGVLQVDWAAFASAEDRFQLEQIIDLYRINSDIFTVAVDVETNEVVGYSCIVPMRRAFAAQFEAGTLDIQDVLAPTVLPLADTENPLLIDYMLDSLVLRNPTEFYIGALLIRHLGRQLSKARKLYSIVSSDYGHKLMRKLHFRHTGKRVFDNGVTHDFYASCLYDSTNPSPIVNVLPKEPIRMADVCRDCLYEWCPEWSRHIDRRRPKGRKPLRTGKL